MEIPENFEPQETLKYLPIFVSKGSSFSNYMFKNRAGNYDYEITGPFGNGLDIKKFSQGKIVFFGMGTGCNPYIDLVDLLARKMILSYTK